MDTKSNYLKLLLDPRWQKLRLEVMSRDDFTCRICGDKDSTLNVHHEVYVGKPWECPTDKLKTLCEKCHIVVEHLKKIHIKPKNINRLNFPEGRSVWLVNHVKKDNYILTILHNFDGNLKRETFTFTKEFIELMLKTF